MRNSGDPTLHTSKIDRFVYLYRIHAAIYISAVFLLFHHHFFSLLSSSNPVAFLLSFTLSLSDVILAFMWFFTQAFRWRPVRRQVYPERLVNKDVPGLDVFVCTADPYKEPPMGVVNTAMSVMAFEYPTEKLSVYVSDDGGSELTLFAFMEAARFARYWLPFCRQNGINERSPEAYFRSNRGSQKIEILYQKMKDKVEGVMKKCHVDDDLVVTESERVALEKWKTGFSRQEHPSVVQVLLQNSRDVDITDHPLPNLVYVSREKSKAFPHHFKAGALNTLLRVSSAMTNAPVLLTLDCDMISNDPTSPLRALCFLLDDELPQNLAFVQFPQRFGGINSGDIYGTEFKRLFQIHPLGMDGLRGPNYVGSNAFFNRRALHGTLAEVTGPSNSEEVLSRAHKVASCTYEHGTKWGCSVGFRYGSLVEDYYTGYRLHCEGWRSVFCDPSRPAFLGDVPVTLHNVLSQAKRWCVGLFEVAFSEHSTITFGVKHASLLMGMAYSHYAFWGLWSFPIISYGILPQITLLHQVALFPKVNDPRAFLYCYLFFGAYAQDLIDFLRAGGSIRRWWNDQRMWLIRGVTCFPLAALEFSKKHMGFSSTGFNVTIKVMEGDQNDRYEKGVFDFGMESPFMVSLGMFAMLSFVSFTIGFAGAVRNGATGEYALQLLISGFVVVNCWPIYDAMVIRKDSGKMPRKCIILSLFLTGVLYLLSYLMLAI